MSDYTEINHVIRVFANDSVTIDLHNPMGHRWHHSEFPHPFVTKDFALNGHLLQIGAVGPFCKQLINAYSEWFDGGAEDVNELVESIDRRIELIPK